MNPVWYGCLLCLFVADSCHHPMLKVLAWVMFAVTVIVCILENLE